MIKFLVLLFAAYVVMRMYGGFKQGHVSTRRFIAWFSLWAGVVVVSWIPRMTDAISQKLGVERGVDLFMFAAIIFMVYLIFSLYTRMEQMRQEVTALVRVLALRELDAEQRDTHDGPSGDA